MIVKLWTKSLSCHKHGRGPVADQGNFCGQIKKHDVLAKLKLLGNGTSAM